MCTAERAEQERRHRSRDAPAEMDIRPQLAVELQAADGQPLLEAEERSCAVSLLVTASTALLLPQPALLFTGTTAPKPAERQGSDSL